MSFDRSDLINDESDDDGSDSGSAGTCAFTFRFDGSIVHVGDSIGLVGKSICCVSCVGSSVFP